MDLTTILIGSGPLGILAALFIWGLVVPKKSYEAIEADRDYWRETFKQEHESHQKTRDAMIQAEKRSDAAVEAAIAANKMLVGLQKIVSKSERA
jgi:hypothetical protein